jgi:hypothetical protein
MDSKNNYILAFIIFFVSIFYFFTKSYYIGLGWFLIGLSIFLGAYLTKIGADKKYFILTITLPIIALLLFVYQFMFY